MVITGVEVATIERRFSGSIPTDRTTICNALKSDPTNPNRKVEGKILTLTLTALAASPYVRFLNKSN